MTNQTITQLICGTVLLLAILAGLFALVWHGSIKGVDAMVTITAIVGIAGGAFAVHAGVNAGANAAGQQMPPSELGR